MDEMDNKIIEKIRELADRKGNLYSVEPVTEWPIDILLAFVAGKAHRAFRKNPKEEKIQELYDCAVYIIKTLKRLEIKETIDLQVK